jgi:hypothetical protein
MIGERFGRLTVLEELRKPSGKQNRDYFRCLCECGREKDILAHSVKTGMTNSCGCLMRETTITRSTTHGMCGTPFYRKWTAMKDRCENENHKSYGNYGGRGICVDASWSDSFENFYSDMYESYLEHVNEFGENQTTLDRIDVNGNYTPENCAWSTCKEQVLNRRKRKDNESGTTGIHFDKKSNKWRAQIGVDGKRKYIGLFTEFDEAVKARHDAEIEYFGNELEAN